MTESVTFGAASVRPATTLARLTSHIALALAMVVSARARAAPAVIAAVAPGDRDARTAVVIGPNGQTYEPDGKGAWIRHHAAAIADDVTRAARAGSTVIVGVDGGPPYAFRAGVWDLVVLGLHAKAVLGRGPRATAAFGKQVFGLDTGKPARLADAPGVVVMIASSAKTIVVQTDQGLARNEGKGWKPIANAPKQVLALLDDRWALVDRGLLDLSTQKITAWPSGFAVASVVAVASDFVVAAGAQGGVATLVTLKKGKLDKEAIALAAPTIAPTNATPIAASAAKFGSAGAPIVSLTADSTGRVVVATRDGQLAVRDKGAWASGALFDELPPAHPGSPPAESK